MSEKKIYKSEKKTKYLLKWWKDGRKDGVEEVEESGLVNKHIFWRSTGGNALEKEKDHCESTQGEEGRNSSAPDQPRSRTVQPTSLSA